MQQTLLFCDSSAHAPPAAVFLLQTKNRQEHQERRCLLFRLLALPSPVPRRPHLHAEIPRFLLLVESREQKAMSSYRLGHVHTTFCPRVAAQNAPKRARQPKKHPILLHRKPRVLTARRIKRAVSVRIFPHVIL
jgi:hypothetical protein